MSAHEAIRQLVARYAVLLDACDLDAVSRLFVPDVSLGPGGTGRAALRDWYAQEMSALGRTFLNVGTHVIDVADDDHATGVVYCHGQIERDGRWVDQQICYRDTYECRNGEWLFVKRRHEVREERVLG